MPSLVNGTKIGRLTVISSSMELYGKGVRRRRRYLTKCECGNEFTLIDSRVHRKQKDGTIFECRKCFNERKRPSLLNSQFGRWTVIAETRHPVSGDRAWLCLCECGKQKIHETHHLTNKRNSSLSCGCYARKLAAKWCNETKYPPAHGLKRTTVTREEKKVYHLRSTLVQKCYSKEAVTYSNYGGKGYVVCDLWRNGAKDFYKWCIENGWEESLELMIRRGKKEFSPQNCYFDERFSNSKRLKTHCVQYLGKRKSVAQWAAELGFGVENLYSRLKKYRKKYGLDKAMNPDWVPDRPKSKNDVHSPEIISMYKDNFTMIEIAEKLNLTVGIVHRILHSEKVDIRKSATRESLKIRELLPKIKEDRERGRTLKEIGETYGLKEGMVGYYLRMPTPSPNHE